MLRSALFLLLLVASSSRPDTSFVSLTLPRSPHGDSLYFLMPSLWWLSSLSLVMWRIVQWLFIACCWVIICNMIGLWPSQCLQCWSLFRSVIGSLLPIIFSLLLLAISVHDTWSSTLIASFMHDRCLSTQSPSSGDVHPLLIKLMGLLVAALFLQCFLGLGSSSTFHHCCADCCADFFVCTDEYWHLDLILWG